MTLKQLIADYKEMHEKFRQALVNGDRNDLCFDPKLQDELRAYWNKNHPIVKFGGGKR